MLLALSWPLAIVLLFVFPLLWLILLPFQIVGFTLGVLFRIIGAILLLPFRVLRLV
jgi:hypothetical protein